MPEIKPYSEVDLSLINEARDAFFHIADKAGVKLDTTMLKKAMDLAITAHQGQYRASGDPYVLHPIAVAEILLELKLDTRSIVTALLHDTLEDTLLTADLVRKTFDDEVLKLVEGVTKLARIEYQPELVKQAENFRKLLLAISEDIRVLLVKLADRLHNMRTIKYVNAEHKRRRIAFETIEIYAPLAERIGIHSFKNELQDLAFAELYPEIRESIIGRLEFLRQAGLPTIKTIITELDQKLKAGGLNAEVTGREKTCCSIWYKMENKNVGFEQLADIIAFRIMVQTVDECYKALGVIHQHYHMLPGSFKDFISTPKANGYKSLHTVIMGPQHQCIEVQIRTYDMHEVAELGVAAHWGYKQRIDPTAVGGPEFRWIKELLDILNNTSNPEEFLENSKLAMYYDRVFCFTPKGELIALPRGATALDFAFALHTDVGLNCIGSRVNGRVAPLKTTLENGDQVEIFKSKTPVVMAAWEKFVTTGKAKSEIRKFLRAKQREEYYNLGKSLLLKALSAIGKEYNELKLHEVLEGFKRNSIEDLIIDVGAGLITRQELLQALHPDHSEPGGKKTLNPLALLNFKPKKQLQTDAKEALPIKGLIPGVAIHFAVCCCPIPGDRIVGIMHAGSGVTIHTVDCETVNNFATNSEEQIVDVNWAGTDHEPLSLMSRIKVVLANEVGGLARLTHSIAEHGVNIQHIKIVNRSLDFFELMLDLEVRGISQLKGLLIGLKALDCVHSAKRYRGDYTNASSKNST